MNQILSHIALDSAQIEQTVTTALAEDIGAGDVTATLVPIDQIAIARVISRENAIICGRAWFDLCFQKCSPNVQITWFVEEGERVAPNAKLCEIKGLARGLLTAERTALNFLQTLSGTATLVAEYVQAIAGTHAKILDTRKTLPNLRMAQKYAVVCGGGFNHRIGLYDAILIKENHIVAAGGIENAIRAARETAPNVPLICEAETLGEAEIALRAAVDVVLIDNFTPAQMREAVALRAEMGSPTQIETSGNVDLSTVHAVAETGVDRISIGSLTKHVRAVDLSMRFFDL